MHLVANQFEARVNTYISNGKLSQEYLDDEEEGEEDSE